MSYKIRFHLANMQWQVKKSDGITYYINPEEYSLTLYDCKLRNRKSTAIKIKEGANKTVCAWIECERFITRPHYTPDVLYMTEISYNPRVCPWWTDNDSSVDLDEAKFDKIITRGKRTFTK